MTWRAEDEQGAESHKIRWLTVPYTRGRGLDIGCGKYKAFPHFIGIDSGLQYLGQKVADIQADGRDLAMFADASLDFVFSSHFLEHVEDTVACLREWWRVLKVGGLLVLYLPHKDFYPNKGEEGANPDHKHDFVPDDIIGAMRTAGKSGWIMLENEERNERKEYSFYQVFRKTNNRKFEFEVWKKAEKACIVVRYGAFGDHIMAQSILPELKARGYHITYNTTERGLEVVRENPHIDAFWMQDPDQVPNANLGPYWEAIAQRFGRVINLSESIEGHLLPMPGSIRANYHVEVRRKLCNKNYLEHTHDIADVPYNFDTHFYPTSQEREWARTFTHRRGDDIHPVILWPLSGSSLHKTWPYAHVLAGWLADHTDVVMVFVGEEREVELEILISRAYLIEHDIDLKEVDELTKKGIGALTMRCTKLNKHHDYTRFIFRSGRISIRQTLALCEFADLMFGPETGVMNAAGQLDVPKVVMLSHSSEENLTKHWINATVLKSEGLVACAPCHLMHYGWSSCFQNKETHAAECASLIDPETAFKAVVSALSLKSVKDCHASGDRPDRTDVRPLEGEAA